MGSVRASDFRPLYGENRYIAYPTVISFLTCPPTQVCGHGDETRVLAESADSDQKADLQWADVLGHATVSPERMF